jgi:Peptidase family C25/Propeptide_C25/FlgD Ig-like domain
MRGIIRYGYLFLFLSICLTCSSHANANDLPFTGVAVGDPLLVKFSDTNEPDDKPVMNVLETSETGLVVEFRLPQIGIQEVDVEGQTFHALEIEGGAYRGEVGEPMLPTFSQLIQIPDNVGVTYEVLGIETTELTGYKPLPMQPGKPTGFEYSAAAYTDRGYGEIERTVIGTPAIARDIRVVPMTINPVRYSPEAGKVEIAHSVTVQVRFEGTDSRNAAPRFHRVIPKSFHNLYQNIVVNYTGPREDQIVGLGSIIIVVPNNSTAITKLQPLIEWRTRRGYDVHMVTTAETGTSKYDIKAWIQDKYDNWDNPPEHILLVGDTYGTLDIAHWTENSTYYGGESDHPYVKLAGNDILADAHIGRISVSSTSELELYVHKIVSYESDPYMTETDWYTTGTVTGDPSDSGYTTIQCMQWLANQMAGHGYTRINSIYTYPYESQTLNKLNTGCSGFGYRGYYHMSSIGTGDIGNLQNGRKMPFAVILTCDTGSFADGYARSEAFMRAGLPPSTPTAGIASIGTATTGTHTRFNNCVTYGIWRNIFGEDQYEFGASLTRGKYELYMNYNQFDEDDVRLFTWWNNLMGDSAGEMWTGVPRDLTVTYPTDVALGTNAIVIEVTDGGSALPGAYVCLWKGEETHVGGYADEMGMIDLPVNAVTAGDMKITVTAHNYKPFMQTINVAQEDLFVGYLAHTLSGDGMANPDETVDISAQVKNFGTVTATEVTGTISSEDPYIVITDGSDSFGPIAGDDSAWGADNFAIAMAPGTPNGHTIRLGLDTESDGEEWHSLIQIPVIAPEFDYRSRALYDFGTRIDPGESGEISVEIENIGALAATAISGRLTCSSSWLIITDGDGSFGDAGLGANVENTSDRFSLSAETDCYPGHVADLLLVLEYSAGIIDSVNFQLTIGQQTTSDPTGPDRYGYYAYDNTDIGYAESPTYNWVELAPDYGGPGTPVGLTDYGVAEDDVQTVTLPFEFTYYGETFTQTSICSNGWMVMGWTTLTNYRNWTIPCAGAPENMIAPMWDNFWHNASDTIYDWYDETNHRYVVQWSRVRNMQGYQMSNFEVILYDPEYYPTETGDGIIEFQFETYNNSDHVQHYSTTGIQNGDNSDGLLFSYFNTQTPGSAAIGSGRVIRFVPMERIDLADAPVGDFGSQGMLLYQNQPNPFGGVSNGTQIRFDLPEAATVQLKVFDASGRLVNTLVDGAMDPGRHQVSWDGSDSNALPAGSGVYFYVLDADGRQQSRRMLILK